MVERGFFGAEDVAEAEELDSYVRRYPRPGITPDFDRNRKYWSRAYIYRPGPSSRLAYIYTPVPTLCTNMADDKEQVRVITTIGHVGR